MEPEEWADRPRGVLTKKDRRYLLNQLDEPNDPDSNANTQREYRIRQHLRHSLIDFQLLASAYDGLLEPVFDDLTEDENILLSDDNILRHGIDGVFTLLYRGLLDFDTDEGLDDRRFYTVLTMGVNEAVSREYARRGVSVEPSQPVFQVHGTAPAVPLGKLKEAYDDGQLLLSNEMKHLYWGGYVSYEEYQNHDPLPELDDPTEAIEERDARREELANEDVPTEPEFFEELKNDIADGVTDDVFGDEGDEE